MSAILGENGTRQALALKVTAKNRIVKTSLTIFINEYQSPNTFAVNLGFSPISVVFEIPPKTVAKTGFETCP